MLRPEQTDVPVIYESLELHRTDPMHTDKIHHTDIQQPQHLEQKAKEYEPTVHDRDVIITKRQRHITPPANIDVVEERYEVIICEREKPNDEQLTVREETALLNEH
ncbi:unnamed protein product, partial [Didymodactylos carnosus]